MADKIDDGGPAFPVVGHPMGEYRDGSPILGAQLFHGLTLRDYFAGQAMQGMGTWSPLAHSDLQTPSALQARAEWAYQQADAMLAERAKGGQP